MSHNTAWIEKVWESFKVRKPSDLKTALTNFLGHLEAVPDKSVFGEAASIATAWEIWEYSGSNPNHQFALALALAHLTEERIYGGNLVPDMDGSLTSLLSRSQYTRELIPFIDAARTVIPFNRYIECAEQELEKRRTSTQVSVFDDRADWFSRTGVPGYSDVPVD